ncbi:MAG: polysaccharide biosynthesis/export family protein [Hyphomicrobiaceae bacterium]
MSRLRFAPIVAALLIGGCATLDDHVAFDTHVAAPPVPVVAGTKSAWNTAMADTAGAVPFVTTTEPVTYGGISRTEPRLAGPQAVADDDGPYLLDSGDRLRVFVFGQPNLSRLYTVDHDGNIVVPLIGKVRARGRTVYGLADTIKTRLAAEFVRDPQVTVDINQNRPFFILGEVRAAGQYPYVSGMTVQTAVAIAGGFSERASKRDARITRRINGVVEVLVVPFDYVLQPGDTIEVRERFL